MSTAIDARPGREAIVVGGGIGGLATALSLHEAGWSVRVFESVPTIEALGVGINLLPHAVRELDALGLLDELVTHGLAPHRLLYCTKRGEEIWSEPRGLAAGYRWPQVSIHRGDLQCVLHEAVLDRLGPGSVITGAHLDSFEQSGDHVTARFVDRRTGAEVGVERGALLVAADGIHSIARRHFYPDEGPPRWNGALLWRGLAEVPAVLDGRTMVWAGHRGQKFVCYPIADRGDGRGQLVNFIAELREEPGELVEREDWNRAGDLADVLPAFEHWRFGWLDVPAILRSAPGTFVFPMVDRDPVERWSFDRVTLLGDAAHPMYPIGSNGASQAILDARVLAGCLRACPDDPCEALRRYDAIRRPATAAIVLANRGMGPELPMQLVEERAPDGFERLDDVITADEIAAVTEGYRQTAGFALAELSDGTSLADRPY